MQAQIRTGLGQRIKDARSRLNINSAELARRAKLSRSAISLYENDKRFPSYHTLRKLSFALSVSIDYLADAGGNQ